MFVILGTNDTAGGSRKCWDHKNDFPQDYRDLIDTLRTFPSIPEVYIYAPSPMVTETPGLERARLVNLQERQPRLEELVYNAIQKSPEP